MKSVVGGIVDPVSLPSQQQPSLPSQHNLDDLRGEEWDPRRKGAGYEEKAINSDMNSQPVKLPMRRCCIETALLLFAITKKVSRHCGHPYHGNYRPPPVDRASQSNAFCSTNGTGPFCHKSQLPLRSLCLPGSHVWSLPTTKLR